MNEDFTRRSAVLSLKRFKGKHTFDMIATLLSDILLDYGIQRKVVYVVTDNGSNFVKAFREFGLQNVQEENDEDFDEDDFELQAYNMDSLEYESHSGEVVLPPHYRCLSHTLSLIATNDLDKVRYFVFREH